MSVRFGGAVAAWLSFVFVLCCLAASGNEFVARAIAADAAPNEEKEWPQFLDWGS